MEEESAADAKVSYLLATQAPSKIKTRQVDFGSGCHASCFEDQGSVLDFWQRCHAARIGNQSPVILWGWTVSGILKGFLSGSGLGSLILIGSCAAP